MILYANGCSLTWGDDLTEILNVQSGFGTNEEYQARLKELESVRPGKQILYKNFEVTLGEDDDYRIRNSWPGILSNLIGCEGHNDAVPGGSNQRIMRTSLDWIADNKDKDLFVVIGWTGLTRIELWNQKNRVHKQHLLNFSLNYSNEDKKFYEKYWRETYNDYERVDNFIHQLIMFQGFLQINNIPFVFFDALPTVNNAELDMAAFDHLDNLIDKKRYFQYNTINGCFYTWTIMNKYKQGPRKHPLEEAHKDWAKILYEYITENNLLKIEEV